jgi:hypothetical protein
LTGEELRDYLKYIRDTIGKLPHDWTKENDIKKYLNQYKISYDELFTEDQNELCNVQQLRRSIGKLKNQMILEVIRPGSKNKPALYVLTYKGKELLNRYLILWDDVYKVASQRSI